MGSAFLGEIRFHLLVPYVTQFLAVSLVVALVTAAIRIREAPRIVQETLRFFVTLVVGVGIFAGFISILEWLFIRSLV